jgi:hypothetical protein
LFLPQNAAENFNAKVKTEDMYRPTSGKQGLHETYSENGVKVVEFATPKQLAKYIMFPHCNIHKYTWIYPKGGTKSH